MMLQLGGRSKMKKILVIFTGGTIGSREDNDKIIDIDESKSHYLLEVYQKSLSKRDVVFDTLNPYSILSENLVVDDWLTLKDTLQGVNFQNYEGIIITHGSDTLPFTSAAISYMFSNTPIPIVLTASNYPLDDNRSNGLRNFISCVDFILDEQLPGIFVLFENHVGDIIVHLGTRLIQAYAYDFIFGNFDFESFDSINFGKMVEGRLIRNESLVNPTIEDLFKPKDSIRLERVGFSPNILCITPEPGLNYNLYDFSKVKPHAVLHNLYHSSTACTRDTKNHEYSLVEFVNYCHEHDVDVYIAPMISISLDQYLSSHILLEHGVIPLSNISTEAAIVKLMMAYGTFDNKYEIHDFLKNSNLFFECFDKAFIENMKRKQGE